MTTLTKTLLGFSAAGFVIAIATDWLWGVGLPIGAIFFGLFLISKTFEQEIARFDVEEKDRLCRAATTNNSKVHSHDEHHEESLHAAA